jgi:hypothetical protein
MTLPVIRQGLAVNYSAETNAVQCLLSHKRTVGQNIIDSTVYDQSALKGSARAVQPGRALTFDGSTGYVNLPLAINATSSYEITGHFRTLLGVLGVIVDCRDVGGDGLLVAINGGRLAVYHNNINPTIQTDANYNDNLWHRFSVIWASGLLTITVDSETKSIVNTGAISTTTNARIGLRAFSTPLLYFNGSLHSISIKTDGVLRANYPMAAGSGTTAYDISGNGYHGTHVGGVTHTTFTDGAGNDTNNQLGYSVGVNYYANSGDFTQANWIKLNVTATANTITGNAGSGVQKYISIGVNPLPTIGASYVLSCNVVKGSGILQIFSNTGWGVASYLNIDVATGATQSATPFPTVSVTDAGAYWRVVVVGLNTGLESSVNYICLVDSLASLRGDTASSTATIQIENIQFQAGTVATAYQQTLSTNNVGAFIPARNATLDAYGNALQFTGKVPYNALLVQSNCLQFDGVSQYISAPHLIGTETVVLKGGTATPSISAGRIDFTAGTCWDLQLSDGTRYTLSEGSGSTVYNVTNNSNHATLVNAPVWTTQGSFHWNLTKGFRQSGAVKIPALLSGVSAADGNPLTNPAINGHNGAETKLAINSVGAAQLINKSIPKDTLITFGSPTTGVTKDVNTDGERNYKVS